MRRWLFGVTLLFSCLPLTFAQTQNADDVVNAIEEDFSKFEWINILTLDYTEDISPPVVLINRFPYDRGSGREGTLLAAEMVYIRVITRGYRYDLAFDFFNSPRTEKGAQKTPNAKREIFGLIASIFPEKFSGDSAAPSE